MIPDGIPWIDIVDGDQEFIKEQCGVQLGEQLDETVYPINGGTMKVITYQFINYGDNNVIQQLDSYWGNVAIWGPAFRGTPSGQIT